MKSSNTSATRKRSQASGNGSDGRAPSNMLAPLAASLVARLKALSRPQQICLAGLVIILVGVLGTATVSRIQSNAQAAKLQALAQSAYQEGIALNGASAPNLRLQDQHGQMVTLQQFRGHPIVVTFFDSVCPHADCSLMAQYINWTTTHLTKQQLAEVDWVAISVDPWHDTPQTIDAFLQSHQVTIPIHYLTGSLDQLTPIWSAFHMQAQEQSDGVVIHTTGVFVLDGKGQEQLYLDEGFNPAVLGGYLQYMLATNATVAGAQANSGTSTGPNNASIAVNTVDGDTIQFTATPGQYGSYDFTVTVEDGQGVPINGAQVALTVTMTTMQMAPVNVNLSPTEIPGAYQAKGVLSMRGGWKAQVQVQVPGKAPLQTSFTFDANY